MAVAYSNPLDFLGKFISYRDLIVESQLPNTYQYVGRVLAVLVPAPDSGVQPALLVRYRELHKSGTVIPFEEFLELTDIEILSCTPTEQG